MKKHISKVKLAHLLTVYESLFNEVADLQVCIFIIKRFQHRCFSVNIANFFLKNLNLKKICERLFLSNVKGYYPSMKTLK